MGCCPWCNALKIEKILRTRWPEPLSEESEEIFFYLSEINEEGKLKACDEHAAQYLGKDPTCNCSHWLTEHNDLGCIQCECPKFVPKLTVVQ